jgi:hypothetical protein
VLSTPIVAPNTGLSTGWPSAARHIEEASTLCAYSDDSRRYVLLARFCRCAGRQPNSELNGRWNMDATSPTPRRVRTPNWLDLRLVAGVTLVIGSMVAGAVTIAAADSSTRVWAVTRDLAPGTVVTSADLKPIKVRLPSIELYFSTSSKVSADQVIGKTVASEVFADQPLPRPALVSTPPATTLTVPLSSDQAPRIARGQRIELWLSSKSCQASVILPSVTVQDVQTGGGGAFGTSTAENVVIRVPADDAARVVAALGLGGTVIRAGLLSGAPGPADLVLQDLTHCGTSS